ncbi:hypothetical protein [Rhodococcus tibetensis]|uniref:DUF222 domain-containing protein n=1 Tax=Rhodococcus tibetensis TaxID=2965064 RepID=A0ABT1Q9U3_9NOCA|nr:hypothetical protein [Rhodococcus sp. FXJ9.536]MCQ4119021.1 hypothetical protein [Rhodococcus sp. FXJ9.536]
MNDDHAQLVADLRALAESALERLEPILQRAAAPHSQDGPNDERAATGEWSGCTWCPVCALAAVIRGEQHDLVTLLANQGTVLVAVLRQILDEHRVHDGPQAPESPPGGSGAEDAPPSPAESAFVPISVTIKH